MPISLNNKDNYTQSAAEGTLSGVYSDFTPLREAVACGVPGIAKDALTKLLESATNLEPEDLTAIIKGFRSVNGQDQIGTTTKIVDVEALQSRLTPKSSTLTAGPAVSLGCWVLLERGLREFAITALTNRCARVELVPAFLELALRGLGLERAELVTEGWDTGFQVSWRIHF